MMRKILLALVVSVVFFSCSSEKSNEVLNIAVSQDVDSLDVMKSTSRVLRDILVGSVYEKLFVLEDGRLEMELASSMSSARTGTLCALISGKV